MRRMSLDMVLSEDVAVAARCMEAFAAIQRCVVLVSRFVDYMSAHVHELGT